MHPKQVTKMYIILINIFPTVSTLISVVPSPYPGYEYYSKMRLITFLSTDLTNSFPGGWWYSTINGYYVTIHCWTSWNDYSCEFAQDLLDVGPMIPIFLTIAKQVNDLRAMTRESPRMLRQCVSDVVRRKVKTWSSPFQVVFLPSKREDLSSWLLYI